jgi:methionine aminopeptidase
VNLTLEGLVSQTIVGAQVLELCEFGTTVMETAASKLYTKKVDGKSIDRGVAFPVCVSVNDVVCNFSPLEVKNDSEPEATVSFVTYLFIFAATSFFENVSSVFHF